MFSGYCTSLRLPALLCVHMFLKEKCGSLHASLGMKIYIIPFLGSSVSVQLLGIILSLFLLGCSNNQHCLF